jgi:hypothetical protein
VCAIVAGRGRNFGAGRESLNTLWVSLISLFLVGGYVTGFPRLSFQTSAFCVKFIYIEGTGLVWFIEGAKVESGRRYAS